MFESSGDENGIRRATVCCEHLEGAGTGNEEAVSIVGAQLHQSDDEQSMHRSISFSNWNVGVAATQRSCAFLHLPWSDIWCTW